MNELAEKYPDIEVLPVQYTGCDPAKSLNIASDMLTGNPELVGFYGACDGPGTGIGQLVKQRDMKGQIKGVSFDVSPDQFLLFLDGYLDALIVQDPYQMGYRGVHAMDQAIHGQEVTDKLVRDRRQGRDHGQHHGARRSGICWLRTATSRRFSKRRASRKLSRSDSFRRTTAQVPLPFVEGARPRLDVQDTAGAGNSKMRYYCGSLLGRS